MGPSPADDQPAAGPDPPVPVSLFSASFPPVMRDTGPVDAGLVQPASLGNPAAAGVGPPAGGGEAPGTEVKKTREERQALYREVVASGQVRPTSILTCYFF